MVKSLKIVSFPKGELGSYYPQEIVERIKQSFEGDSIFLNTIIDVNNFMIYIKEGVVEVWLTSEDTGAYGRDIGHNIVDLLWEIIKVIPDGL